VARAVLAAVDAVEGGKASGSRMVEAARAVVKRLERQLEQARDVGD